MIATMTTAAAQAARYRSGQAAGHYESWFLRANHPGRPRAFWLRYTLFAPDQAPERAVGELWAIAFDGESGRHVAARTELPIAACGFGTAGLDVRLGAARLTPDGAVGAAAMADHRIAWDLRWRGEAGPLPLLPAALYAAPLPRAKSLVTLPLARFDGRLTVDGEDWAIDGWRGSENHNWGSRHTDDYVYGQVTGFDESPDTVLDCAAARLRLGPVWSPRLTPLALRHRGRVLALNGLGQAARNRSRLTAGDELVWEIMATGGAVTIGVRFTAPRAAFVGLTYRNPPGGVKHCLNSKIARVTLDITENGQRQTLTSRQGGLFEIVPAGADETYGIALAI